MADPWALTLQSSNDTDRKRVQWLIKALQHDPHIRRVEVTEAVVTARYQTIQIVVYFVEDQDLPYNSTLRSLDHTHGERVAEVTPPTWLERIQRDDDTGV